MVVLKWRSALAADEGHNSHGHDTCSWSTGYCKGRIVIEAFLVVKQMYNKYQPHRLRNIGHRNIRVYIYWHTSSTVIRCTLPNYLENILVLMDRNEIGYIYRFKWFPLTYQTIARGWPVRHLKLETCYLLRGIDYNFLKPFFNSQISLRPMNYPLSFESSLVFPVSRSCGAVCQLYFLLCSPNQVGVCGVDLLKYRASAIVRASLQMLFVR